MGKQEVKCRALFLSPLLLSLADGYLLLSPAGSCCAKGHLVGKDDTNTSGGAVAASKAPWKQTEACVRLDERAAEAQLFGREPCLFLTLASFTDRVSAF